MIYSPKTFLILFHKCFCLSFSSLYKVKVTLWIPIYSFSVYLKGWIEKRKISKAEKITTSKGKEGKGKRGKEERRKGEKKRERGGGTSCQACHTVSLWLGCGREFTCLLGCWLARFGMGGRKERACWFTGLTWEEGKIFPLILSESKRSTKSDLWTYLKFMLPLFHT